MRILHLEASNGWGGQEIRILREAEGMRARGHEVVFGVEKGGGLVARARAAGFVVYEMAFRKLAWPVTLLRLLQILRRHKIDLVNTHSSLDGWIGGIAARIARKKVIRTRHISAPIRPGINSRLLYGILADFVVTTCSAIVPIIEMQAKTACRSIATGVDPEKIKVDAAESKAFREKWGIGAKDFLVGTACVMRSWKGIDDLLEAANLLRDMPNLRWVVIGGGHADRHHCKARELGVEGLVQFTGHLDDPFPAMGALDAFALLSTANEGVSQAILQAAYLGKPLIATPVGGLCEVCVEGKTGLQVPPFAPEQVARAVCALKEDRELSDRLGRGAREWTLAHFTWGQTLDQMEEVYQRVSTK